MSQLQKFLVALLFTFSILGVGCAPNQTAVETAVSITPTDPADPLPTNPSPTAQPTTDENDAGAIAYVQNNTLYIQNSGQAPLSVDACPPGTVRCVFHYLKWSPNNQHLLYYYHDDSGTGALHLADRQGNRQAVDQAVQFVMPGDWSPDGQGLIFLGEGSLIVGSEGTPNKSLHEVWTAVLDSSGQLQPAKSIGQAERLGDGCGGGGRSASQELYEREGGTAYGYLMSVVEWTAPDILIYTTGCDNQTVGRFDIQSGVQLPPFDRAVRNLVLTNDHNQWFGIGGPSWSADPVDHQIVQGVAGKTAVTPIPTSQPAELVFYGSVSDTLYYTTLTTVETHSDLPSGDNFSFNTVSLWQLNLDGSSETMRWQSDDHAIAQLSELANGEPIFVRIENDRDLYEKLLEDTTQTASDLPAFLPRRHIYRLAANGTLQPLIDDAGNPEPTHKLGIPVPELRFDGETGGCGNIFAYRSNAGRTEYIQIFINARNIPLSTTPTTVDIAQHPEDVMVQLDHFADDVRNIDNFPYCNDVVPVATPQSIWQAQNGRLTITLSTDSATLDCTGDDYTATILLENLTLNNGTETLELDSVAIEEVTVGWCAG